MSSPTRSTGGHIAPPSTPGQPSAPFTLEPLSADAVADYVWAHVEFTVATYAHVVGVDFARNRRGEVADRIAEVRHDLDAAAAAGASGRPAFRRHWVARNPPGGIVGVCSAGLGVGAWEEEVCGDFWTPPATEFTVSHLYTAAALHGSGVGQALLDAALPADASAYLWIISGNDRARRFYERNGFAFDGLHVACGGSWTPLEMDRLVRLR